ncbi:Transcription factor [Marasmius tenuissimus]|nr:Transcription factor [Marasmius tenuissimus]
MTSTGTAAVVPRRIQQAQTPTQRIQPAVNTQQQAQLSTAAGTSSATSVSATQTAVENSEDTASANGEAPGDGGKKKKATKRRKVNHACLYCRRSHMTCDDGRPCQRCIKREIGHLCHDERRPRPSEKPEQPIASSSSTTPAITPATTLSTIPGPSGAVSYSSLYSTPQTQSYASSNPTWPMGVNTSQSSSFLYRPDTLGNEFSVLTDFLETLDDASFFAAPSTVAPSLMSASNANGFGGSLSSFGNFNPTPTSITQPSCSSTSPAQQQPLSQPLPALQQQQSTPETPTSSASNTQLSDPPAPPLPSDSLTKTEKFLLTAADQEDGSRDERLNRVIRSKYEAGLLRPYNYVKGYARLSRWMERKYVLFVVLLYWHCFDLTLSSVSQESKQQILQPLSVLRPKFRVCGMLSVIRCCC